MKEPTYYMFLPFTEREKLREKQKLHSYREFARMTTKLDLNTQMNAESEYLIAENKILYQRLTHGDQKLLDITPDNFRVLGTLAMRLPERFRKDLTIMKYEELMQGCEHYKKHPPMTRTNQISLQVEQLIVDMALRNLTWGAPHIQHSARNVGFKKIKEYHVKKALVKNHIPNTRRRVSQGLSWRDFFEGIKNSKSKGVIFK